MRFSQTQLRTLETPCLIVDVQTARDNIAAMQAAADAAGCALRPHIKTHKMVRFARMQIEAGARGVTCAKVGEAEVMADGGIDDLFIAYPLVGPLRIRRAIALARRVKRLILSIDSEDGARLLSEAAVAAGCTLEVRLEIDTGAGRTGIAMAQAPALAQQVARLPGLRLTGIYTFKSLIYQGKPTTDPRLAAREEGELMAAVAQAIRGAGVPVWDLSAGSSPTGIPLAQTGLVNEIRPGTYLFKDVMLKAQGVAQPAELAVRYAATVVSVSSAGYAVIDGGSKAFPTDVPLNTPPYDYPGYAVVEGLPHLRLSRMNEEHGILTSEGGETGLSVGQVLTLLPIHVCTAVNLQNSVTLWEDGAFTQETVDARGMLL